MNHEELKYFYYNQNTTLLITFQYYIPINLEKEV